MASAAIAAVPQRTTTNSTAFPWSTGTYVYDGAGNIVGIGANVYRDDAVNRLVEATADTPQHQNRQTYVYDAFGNLTTVNTSVERQGAAPDDSIRLIGIDPATNRLHQSQCGGSTVGNVKCISGNHDEAGNQVSSTAGMLFEYDALGMMTRLRAGLRNEQYVYDANNERVAILEGADSRISIRNVEGKVVREFAMRASQWEWTKDYVHRESSLLAAVVPTPAGEERRHFHSDHLGTPRLITDDRGFKLALHTYWPFGEEAPGSERDAERMKFTGHERDFGSRPDQDLDYMHARFYGAGAGRFFSVDPVLNTETALRRPQTWNRYNYVANNPINSTDPTGAILISLSGQQTLWDIAGTAAANVTFQPNGVIDTSQFTQQDLSGNEGALLLRQMAVSPKVYTYEESSQAQTRGGVQKVNGVLNLDDSAADVILPGGKPLAKEPGRFPVAGVNGAVTVDPAAQYVDAATGTHKVPTRAIAFHELAESYAKVENKMLRGPNNGPGAHYVARLREVILMMQRPNWTPYPAGGDVKR